MSDSAPDKRTVPVLTEVIDDGLLPGHEPLEPVSAELPTPDLGEPLIDLSDEGLHLPVQELAVAPVEEVTAAMEPAMAASAAVEAGALLRPVLDDEALRLLLSQTLERTIPSLVDQLLPEIRRQLQAQLDALHEQFGPGN